jgi:hypothetical protein
VSAADDEVTQALAEVARLSAEAAALADTSAAGTAITPAGGGLPAEQAKTTMVELRHQAAEKASQLAAAQKHARDAIEAQRRALDTQLAQMSAALVPLRRQIDRLEEGIWSVNLYLGVGEGIELLADGKPAPAGTPIHVRQLVLAMDEECAVAAESGGIDHLEIGQFDEWITADPAHLEQLIPEPRGVVAIMPRRSDKDYGDSFANAVRNVLNHQTYLLIRNGGCVYRYIADGFSAGRRLTPLRDEFTSLFTVRQYNPVTHEHELVQLEPGSPGWERAEQAAGARERHFMRIALILQGLIDRTAVFCPLPAANLSVLHPQAYDDGHIVLVADDEMTLSSGRRPFRDWLRERNGQLRPGMRIVGNFGSQGWTDSNNCLDSGGARPRFDIHSRVWPRTASHPQTGEIYTLGHRAGHYLVFPYDRTDQVWRRDVPVPDEPGWIYPGLTPADPRQRASARISPGEDLFVIPLDLVTIAECEAYLKSREDRHAYRDMFPVLKAAIAAKRTEAEAEAPMRQLLAGHIAREHGVDVADAEAAVPDLVDWWKLANRWHRPLVTGGLDPKAEARAVTAISREFAARRAAARADDDEPERVRRLRGHVPAAMLVARKRDGAWVVLEPQPRSIDGQPGNVWVREHTWSKSLAGHRVRDWILPGPSQLARWRVLWSSPLWDGWDTAAVAADHLTDPDITAITTAVLDTARKQAAEPYRRFRNAAPETPLGGRPVAVASQQVRGRTEHQFTVYWLCARGTSPDRGADGAQLTVRWRRSTGGRVVSEPGRLHERRWTSLPWTHQEHLVWRDAEGVTALEGALRAHREAEDASHRVYRAASSLCRAIAEQWSQAAREAARRKFIADYGDESLWPDHSAALRFDCPHTGHGLFAQPWQQAVERLVGDGAALAGRTVADMASMHAGRYGETVAVPEDIAHYSFPDPDGPDETPPGRAP